MELLAELNRRVKKLSFLDIQFIKISNWFFALLVAKLIPGIMNAEAGLFAVLVLIFALKPFYVAWIRE